MALGPDWAASPPATPLAIDQTHRLIRPRPRTGWEVEAWCHRVSAQFPAQACLPAFLLQATHHRRHPRVSEPRPATSELFPDPSRRAQPRTKPLARPPIQSDRPALLRLLYTFAACCVWLYLWRQGSPETDTLQHLAVLPGFQSRSFQHHLLPVYFSLLSHLPAPPITSHHDFGQIYIAS